MEYVYAGMWLIVGLVLIIRMSKENKIFYFAGGYFLFLGAWWLANAFLPINLFTGGWGMALRVITGLALAAFCIVFFRDYRKGAAKEKGKEEQADRTPKDGGAHS
jgi:membrane protein implicated in regulation of membrane protease activity